MDNEQLAELQNRLTQLEQDNKRLQQSNEELAGEVAIWKPGQRVEVAQPADRRTAKEFAQPKRNIRQFRLEEALAIPETELFRAISNHMQEQLPHLVDAPAGLVYNCKVLYPTGLLKALRGKHKDAKKEGYRDYGHCLILQQFGFTPFVSDQEVRTNVF
ncbi:MAG: hypothetical protein SFV55_28820 [Haliscomenobacter sp.]|uniref:hypothetical protein n=1 Tax=Haliscomenobacter sp. TaxID=2717303 RepID=UPI0029BA1356|nr:hypothetical protein [Haliscomenobacter sp.]MDX2072471.1 hypothetical protein [Haliscomenobacter sp.]